MILKTIYITAAPNHDPSQSNRFVWNEGDPLHSLEIAIAALQSYVDEHKPKAPVEIATLNSLPIETNPPL